MLGIKPDETWSSLQLWVALSIATILIFNLAVIMCASIWVSDRHHLNSNPYRTQPSNTQLVFYTFTMPLFTISQTPFDLWLIFKGILPPVFALVISTISLCGWVIQVSFWFHCEVSTRDLFESIPAWCPNASGDPDVGQRKLFLGVFVAIAFLTYLVLAGVAVARGRKDEKVRAEEKPPQGP